MGLRPQIQPIQFKGFGYVVWRDDLYELIPGEKAFGGNKARKLYHYVMNDFPDITTLVSYGSPQSNMLFSLSRLAQIKGWEFEFFVDHVPQNLFEKPRGNYALALQNGAKIKKLTQIEFNPGLKSTLLASLTRCISLKAAGMLVQSPVSRCWPGILSIGLK